MSDVWYSTNEEDFTFTELADAVEYVFGDSAAVTGDHLHVWKGDAVRYKASEFAPDVLETLYERACDECGEHADNWPDSTPEQGKELVAAIEAAIDEWADNHALHPTFGTVDNVEEVWVQLTTNDGDFKIVDKPTS